MRVWCGSTSGQSKTYDATWETRRPLATSGGSGGHAVVSGGRRSSSQLEALGGSSLGLRSTTARTAPPAVARTPRPVSRPRTPKTAGSTSHRWAGTSTRAYSRAWRTRCGSSPRPTVGWAGTSRRPPSGSLATGGDHRSGLHRAQAGGSGAGSAGGRRGHRARRSAAKGASMGAGGQVGPK